MGNKLGRRRQVVDEKYTRPQGLYQHKDVDHKKLRKLILEAKLAPCYLGEEECSCVLEECPICFLYYPSLNRSRCCTKSICTECFLQMKTPNSARPTQCPFCKTSNYAVEYRGVKTKEEKGMEQIEEQRVIEAKIRMRQQERLDEEERIQKRNEISSSSEIVAPGEVECSTIAVPSSSFLIEGEEIASPQDIRTAQAIRPPLNSRQTRDYEFDLDLEDIMVMEAIWLSIQENGRHKNPAHGDIVPSEQYMVDKHLVSTSIAPVAESSPSSSSPSGGLACAIAALAERQQICGESSSQFGRNTPSLNILPSEQEGNLSCRTSATVPGGSNAAGVGPSYACSDVSEAGPSYACSDAAEGVGFTAMVPPPPPPPPGGIVPESFEEQMMLAMAVSLAEARALTGPQGVPWH